uniref:Uncharacterized protein n=1 Tax=Anguilla anguilla TaxID=7936 RepID=A0A0E9TZW8_ANGAN
MMCVLVPPSHSVKWNHFLP